MLLIAFLINFIIIICELLTLGHMKGKQNILKYYTYLQNFLGFNVSLIFCISFIVCHLSDKTIPEFVRGLRYIASCGLLATMFVFIVFLEAGKKIYMILSAAKLWEEPYHFAAQERKHKTNEIISVLLIPLSFIVISFVLWNLQ